jgi:hypothetical protein
VGLLLLLLLSLSCHRRAESPSCQRQQCSCCSTTIT